MGEFGRVLPTTIYVVDLFAAGEQVAGELMRLMRAALEDSSKTKVLHDARMVGGSTCPGLGCSDAMLCLAVTTRFSGMEAYYQHLLLGPAPDAGLARALSTYSCQVILPLHPTPPCRTPGCWRCQYDIHLAGTFDTQLVHGLVALAQASGSIAAPDTARIGLGKLLAKYGYSRDNKKQVHKMMDSNPRWVC